MTVMSTPIRLFRRWLAAAYSRDVGIARRGRRLEPVPPPPGVEAYSGLWVAVLGDKVIAAAPTSTDLAYKLFEIGPSAKEAVMQRVQPATDEILVGMG